MRTPTQNENSTQQQVLLQAAIRSYLGLVITAADSMAAVCPEIGTAYRNRLCRLPQRIGFDVSVTNLEKTRDTVEMDLHRFADLAGRYVGLAGTALQEIAAEGSDILDCILETAADQVALLESLADQIEAAVDLDRPEDIREAFEHQPAGLRRIARRLERELLPSMTRFRATLRKCEEGLDKTRAAMVVDTPTGYLRRDAFEQELRIRTELPEWGCLILADFTAKWPEGSEPTQERTDALIGQLANRTAEQFRGNDVLGRLDEMRFGVIFDGPTEVATARSPQIAASLSTRYSLDGVDVEISASLAVIEVVEWEGPESVLEKLAAPVEGEPAAV
jgi:GGDEF domain-containing protein